MYINQISVFIENKSGNLANFTNFLADNQIDIRAFEIADSSDFGIIRIIVDKPFDTVTLLKDNGWICNLTQVIGIKIADKPGSMATVLNVLSDANVGIDYAYTFVTRKIDDALMIFRVEDNEKVSSLLKKNGFKLVAQEDLAGL
jgi:hypothetical protein